MNFIHDGQCNTYTFNIKKKHVWTCRKERTVVERRGFILIYEGEREEREEILDNRIM